MDLQTYSEFRASLVAQMVKNLPAVQETQVPFLDREDPLEEEMATHSSILAGRIPWTEESGWLQSMGSQRVGHNRVTNSFTLSLSFSILSNCQTHIFRKSPCAVISQQRFYIVADQTHTNHDGLDSTVNLDYLLFNE